MITKPECLLTSFKTERRERAMEPKKPHFIPHGHVDVRYLGLAAAVTEYLGLGNL